MMSFGAFLIIALAATASAVEEEFPVLYELEREWMPDGVAVFVRIPCRWACACDQSNIKVKLW